MSIGRLKAPIDIQRVEKVVYCSVAAAMLSLALPTAMVSFCQVVLSHASAMDYLITGLLAVGLLCLSARLVADRRLSAKHKQDDDSSLPNVA